MDRRNLILAALSPGDGATYTPVQIQKLLFLIDKRIPHLVDGPFFNFVPYDYGPFDAEIYGCLESLAIEGFVEIISEPGLRWNKYRLTPEGYREGQQILSTLGSAGANSIRTLNEFVRKLPFAQLVASIYKAYPDMKANSVFRD